MEKKEFKERVNYFFTGLLIIVIAALVEAIYLLFEGSWLSTFSFFVYVVVFLALLGMISSFFKKFRYTDKKE